MLEEYPQDRSSAVEVLDHPWVLVSTGTRFVLKQQSKFIWGG